MILVKRREEDPSQEFGPYRLAIQTGYDYYFTCLLPEEAHIHGGGAMYVGNWAGLEKNYIILNRDYIPNECKYTCITHN